MASKGVLSNFLWRLAERSGAQIVSLVVSIVLARLLDPVHYGTVALITVIINILQVFIDSGLGNALIQKKNSDNTDFSTVFFFNIAVCIFLYILMFVSAPFIANFYQNNDLVPLIRVVSITLLISGVKNIQQAYVSKKMIFKRFFFATLGGTILSAVIGIIMAYYGCGVWALVTQHLTNAAVDTIILWITVKWRPELKFSFQRLKQLFSYGWKLLVSSLIDKTYENLRQLLIGKLYSSGDLAFYNKGKQFPELIVINVNSSIDSVLFPSMSKAQDDTMRVKQMTRRAIKTSTYVMAPLMMGLAFCGTTVISLILTEKWLPCVPFMQIFCVSFMFYPIHSANLNAMKALGRSDLFLKLEIIKKIVGMILLLSTMWFGPMAMAYSMLASSILSQIINTWPNKKLIKYGYLEQLKDILPGILLAAFMGVCVKLIEFLPFGLPLVVTLIFQILVGATIYIMLSKLFRLESFEYLLGIGKSFLNKKNKKEKSEL